jgi:cytochrome c-type biogenesis protein CcmE
VNGPDVNGPDVNGLGNLGLDDQESPDAAPLDGDGLPAAGAGFDLTPRTGPADSSVAARRRSHQRRNLAIGGLAVLVVALGFVLFRGLNDAATFFLNVDEAVAKQSTLEGKRFRMQGNVVPGTVEKSADGVTFVLAYHGKKVTVSHTGTPPELFGPDIPVVLEGTFTGSTFASDQILIKHDNTYDENNPDRVKQAQQDAEANSATGGK